MSLLAAEETQTVAASEAAKVAAIVGPRIAGSRGQGRLIGAVAVADRDAGIDDFEARVFRGCFVSGNAKREAAESTPFDGIGFCAASEPGAVCGGRRDGSPAGGEAAV
jgi:hypothetical protein